MLFISHASADDAFVADLRKALEDLRIPVWVDSRSLQAGGKLAPEIEGAIQDAESFLVVLSPATVNSPWVRREKTTGQIVFLLLSLFSRCGGRRPKGP